MAAVCMSQYDTQLSAVRVRTVGTINYACMESAPTSPVSWRGLWWRAQALLVYRNAAIQLPNRPYLSRPRGGEWPVVIVVIVVVVVVVAVVVIVAVVM